MAAGRCKDHPAGDSQGFAVNKCIRYFLMGLLQDPPKGRPGDIHLCCGLFLKIPLQICKAERLELVERKNGDFNPGERDALRFEGRKVGEPADIPLLGGACHDISYEHVLITNIRNRREECQAPQGRVMSNRAIPRFPLE